jgi:hypothetical protein
MLGLRSAPLGPKDKDLLRSRKGFPDAHAPSCVRRLDYPGGELGRRGYFHAHIAHTLAPAWAQQDNQQLLRSATREGLEA